MPNTERTISNVVKALSGIGEIRVDERQREGFVLRFPTINYINGVSKFDFALFAYVPNNTWENAKVIDQIFPQILSLPNLSNNDEAGYPVSVQTYLNHMGDENNAVAFYFSVLGED